MAQQKRLTRAQKILLSRIRAGEKVSATSAPSDFVVLEERGLIKLETSGWTATKENANG